MGSASPHLSVAAIVLAGGRSTRIGGDDKALLPLAGRDLLSHVISRIQPQVSEIAISWNSDPARLGHTGRTILADQAPERLGPLAGILAGLEWASGQRGMTHLACVAVDTPFLPRDLVHRLAIAEAKQPGAVAVARSEGRRHPVISLWPISAREPLARRLAAGERKVDAFLDEFGVVETDFLATSGFDPFFNINTPDDLRLAAQLASICDRPVFGITGWKNSGKTTLTERLVTRFTDIGLTVSTIKHAHHSFDIDHEGTDSHRHRAAGAKEVAIVSSGRWALMHELRNEAEPSLQDILLRLSPCDLVLIEGYKRLPHPKIELRRRDARQSTPMASHDPAIVAIASDGTKSDEALPVFGLDDIDAIAGFILETVGSSHGG